MLVCVGCMCGLFVLLSFVVFDFTIFDLFLIGVVVGLVVGVFGVWCGWGELWGWGSPIPKSKCNKNGKILTFW